MVCFRSQLPSLIFKAGRQVETSQQIAKGYKATCGLLEDEHQIERCFILKSIASPIQYLQISIMSKLEAHINGLCKLYTDTMIVNKVYHMRSTRFVFWNHYEIIVRTSNQTYLRLSFQSSSGLEVQVYSSFEDARNVMSGNQVILQLSCSTPAVDLLKYLLTIKDRPFSYTSWSSTHFSQDILKWLHLEKA